jgi:hypothetical protein
MWAYFILRKPNGFPAIRARPPPGHSTVTRRWASPFIQAVAGVVADVSRRTMKMTSSATLSAWSPIARDDGGRDQIGFRSIVAGSASM